MRVDIGDGVSKPKRVRLAAETLDQARAELEAKRTENRRGQLHVPGRRPGACGMWLGPTWRARNLAARRYAVGPANARLARWVAEIGDVRGDWVKRPALGRSAIAARARPKASNRQP